MSDLDGAELQMIREYLGLSVEDLAGLLSVNPRTLRSWESGRDPIPRPVRGELAALEEEAGQVVDDMAEALGSGVGLAIADVDRRRLGDLIHPRTMPARWWRHALARARERVPGVVVVDGWARVEREDRCHSAGHDWRNWKECGCRQPGCSSYQEMMSGPGTAFAGPSPTLAGWPPSDNWPPAEIADDADLALIIHDTVERPARAAMAAEETRIREALAQHLQQTCGMTAAGAASAVTAIAEFYAIQSRYQLPNPSGE